VAARRVVMVAMPCREVVEIGGALAIFYAANVRLPRDQGYAVEVVSPGLAEYPAAQPSGDSESCQALPRGRDYSRRANRRGAVSG
jgi:hypothetical protein